MSNPVNQALFRLVEQSSNPDEMTRRVISSFGEGKIAHAQQIAAETKGLEWLYSGKSNQTTVNSENLSKTGQRFSLNAIYRMPSLIALLAGTLVLLTTILFPPFIIPLPQGMVNNAGFAFLLSPPTQGGLAAIVNSPLLAILACGIAFSTVAVYVILRHVESALGMSKKL